MPFLRRNVTVASTPLRTTLEKGVLQPSSVRHADEYASTSFPAALPVSVMVTTRLAASRRPKSDRYLSLPLTLVTSRSRTV